MSSTKDDLPSFPFAFLFLPVLHAVVAACMNQHTAHCYSNLRAVPYHARNTLVRAMCPGKPPPSFAVRVEMMFDDVLVERLPQLLITFL
ncbi:hypothetical protein BD626DRAFT_519612, partial [Schizophyllum amplum]